MSEYAITDFSAYKLKHMRLMASDCTSGELATLPSFGFQFAQVDAAEHTKLKVRVELEVERRLRIQSALDNAEKRCYASNRLLEKKVRCPTAKQIFMLNNHTWLGLINSQCGELEDRESAWAVARENLESRLNKSEGDNERLERMIREKEAKIVESERVAKDLMLKAEEFEDMFIGEILRVHNCKKTLMGLSEMVSAMCQLSRTTGNCEESAERPQRGVRREPGSRQGDGNAKRHVQ